MAAIGHGIWHYWTSLCLFGMWSHGLNGAPQSGLDPAFTPTFDAIPQQQAQQPIPQAHQQPWQEVIEQKATGNSENSNNLTPLDLNICSETNYRSVDTLPGLRRSTEVRTLQLGQAGVIWPMSNRSIPFNTDCLLQLSACSACQILISWNSPPTEIHPQVSPDLQQVDRDKYSCETIWDYRDRQRCVDLRLIETDADQTTLKPYQRLSLLNAPSEYRSQFVSSSYKLDLNLQFWRGDVDRANAMRQLFPLKYMVIDNTKIIRGRPSPGDLPTNYSDGFIASPRFPKTYPEGVTVNYTLINDDPEGSIRLVFTDFRLHYMSILKIIDSNGQEIANTQSQYGISQRPSAIQSTGHTLTVIFTANNYKREIGFRANYKFVKEKSWLGQPSPKSCDKVFEDTGGTITIESLNLDAYTYVDCIWILEKPRYATVGFDKLYLKIEDFSVNSGGKGVQLDVHIGRTSINRRILTIFGPKSSEQLAREQPQEGFISDTMQLVSLATTTIDEDDSDTGFYLRLRGFLGSSNGMDIAFAQFYRWATAICHDLTEFHCDNGRCVSNRYQCDGHDHCGDFSDEIKCQNRKSDHGPRIRGGIYGPDGEMEGSGLPLGGYTTTILLVAGLIGLTLVLLMVTIIVARVYRQKLIRRFATATVLNAAGDGGDDGVSGISTSNSLMNRSSSGMVMAMDDQIGTRPAPTMHQIGNRRLLVLPESEIGVLEAPPTYDDALKHPTVPPSMAATLLRSSQSNNPETTPSASASVSGQGSTSATISSAALAAMVGLPSYSAAASTDGVSTSFDNPAFDQETDTADGRHDTVSGDQRRTRKNRHRRSQSVDSTSSSASSSGSENGDSCGSCTGSDLETASDADIAADRTDRDQNGAGTSQAMVVDDPIRPPNPIEDQSSHESPQNISTAPPLIPVPQLPNHGVRKPPVPLPRSSRMARFSTQSHDQTGGQIADFEAGPNDSEPSVSNRTRLNDTLV